MGKLSASLGSVLLLLVVSIETAALGAESLAGQLGRRETRVLSSGYDVVFGKTVQDHRLADRLQLEGYQRVRERPKKLGEFFWGHEVFWIRKRAEPRLPDRLREPWEMVGLKLEKGTGRVLSAFSSDASGANQRPLRRFRLEPVVLAESLSEPRAPRRPVALDRLPEILWQSLLAAEDHRFFDHSGLEARAIARALLKNAKEGRVVQGGSTITQQLVKNRDLSPKRTLGRKVSEAFRTLAIEAEFDKTDILETYLNTVYLGHLNGVPIHGVDAASTIYFGHPAEELSGAEAVVLAAMVQGPNRLSPLTQPAALVDRFEWILDRLEALEWQEASRLNRLRAAGLPSAAGAKQRVAVALHRPLLSRLQTEVSEITPDRLASGRGVWVESSLDPLFQKSAEEAVVATVQKLEARQGGDIQAALVAVDLRSGGIRAYVGGDPRRFSDSFDRASLAERQPGSTLKPLVLLEALQSCGSRAPVHPATRIADRPISIATPGGSWEPQNSDRKFRGEVDLRQAVRESLNVPFVHLASWCGFDATIRRLNRAGIDLSVDSPPSFVLGSIELSPIELLDGFGVIGADGWRRSPRLVTRVLNASGRRPRNGKSVQRPVVDRATAFIVRDLLSDVVARGTGGAAGLSGRQAWGKTGTSSGRRDAWFVGGAGDLAAVVWIGRDDGSPLGETGGSSAAVLWRDFMGQVTAAQSNGRGRQALPYGVVERWIDESTGLRVESAGSGRRKEKFRRRHQPPLSRWYRKVFAPPVVGEEG